MTTSCRLLPRWLSCSQHAGGFPVVRPMDSGMSDADSPHRGAGAGADRSKTRPKGNICCIMGRPCAPEGPRCRRLWAGRLPQRGAGFRPCSDAGYGRFLIGPRQDIRRPEPVSKQTHSPGRSRRVVRSETGPVTVLLKGQCEVGATPRSCGRLRWVRSTALRAALQIPISPRPRERRRPRCHLLRRLHNLSTSKRVASSSVNQLAEVTDYLSSVGAKSISNCG